MTGSTADLEVRGVALRAACPALRVDGSDVGSNLGSPLMPRPAFLITIDTEGDNLWSTPRTMSTVNAEYLPRFQAICERFGFLPTYLTNFEMAQSTAFRAFAKDVLAREVGEIGMHLHAWDSPPLVPLTNDDACFQPFLLEYPEDVMRQKIRTLTDLLRDVFEVPIISHRAGRWAFDSTYARLLIEHGYLVDCSVTPNHSWGRTKGHPGGVGGPDYRGFPELPYFIDPADPGSPGTSCLLEVPMTVIETGSPALVDMFRSVHPARLAYRLFRKLARLMWLRPNGRNLVQMLQILHQAEAEGRPHVEFMLHSSEFMPGGSPTFPTEEHVERLFIDIERLFAAASGRYESMTLGDFRFRRGDRGGPAC